MYLYFLTALFFPLSSPLSLWRTRFLIYDRDYLQQQGCPKNHEWTEQAGIEIFISEPKYEIKDTNHKRSLQYAVYTWRHSTITILLRAKLS